MKAFIEYKAIRGGKVVLGNHQAELELLGVSSPSIGRFDVKGVGPAPSVDELLYLPVKGAKKVALKLKVLNVESLIQPSNAWQAACLGPEFREFTLRHMNINCDACHQDFALEFVHYSAAAEDDAIEAMQAQGWQASKQMQVCPDCLSRKSK